MRANVEDMHLKESEIFNRKQEIAEIQKALSDSHLAIYDEKQTVNGLRLEYEDLLKTEKADLRRIRELQALNSDVAQKSAASASANFKDCRPEASKKNYPLSKKEKALQKGSEVAVTLNPKKGAAHSSQISDASTARSQ